MSVLVHLEERYTLALRFTLEFHFVFISHGLVCPKMREFSLE